MSLKNPKILRKCQENLSMIFSVMLRKLRLRQKNGFLIKKRVHILPNISRSKGNLAMKIWSVTRI